MLPVAPEATSTVAHQPCRYRARAWWKDQLVAESTAAVRAQDDPDRPPTLWFPRADVRFDLFRDEGRQVACPVKGDGQLWSIDDAEDALWVFGKPPAGLEWLADLASFDHDRVRVELVDTVDGEDDREVSIKRFPTWGDATDLIAAMDVRAGDERGTGDALVDQRRPVVEGSQMLGQAIIAAMRHANGRRVVSGHMIFHRAADSRLPLSFGFEELSNGRTFTTLVAHVDQAGRRRATGTLLLDVTAPAVIAHAPTPATVAGPYDSRPHDMGVTGRDIRVVDGAYSDRSDAPVGPAVIDAWVRFREVPDDPAIHAGLLAQFTGHMSIAAAMRPHAGVGQDQAHRTLSTGINAIGISFHTDVRADRWMRYRHVSTFAGDGMTHSECTVHDEAGTLLASFSVDAMVRGFAGGGHAANERTAL